MKTVASVSVLAALLLLPNIARATPVDTLQIIQGCSPQAAFGPDAQLGFNGFCSMPPGGPFFNQSEIDSVGYDVLGTIVSGLGPGSLVAALQSLQNVTIGGIPTGQMVDMNFVYLAGGGYSYGIADDGQAALFIFLQAGIENEAPLKEFEPFRACGLSNFLCHQEFPDASVSDSGGGTAEIFYQSGPEQWPVGIPFQLVQTLNVQPQAFFGTASALFFHTASIVDIEVTDPNTGLPIPGVTVTSDTGVVFPVNGSGSAPAVPEPATLMLVGSGLVFSARRWRRSE